MGFVDDYTAWVIGSNTDENTQELQKLLILKVSKWEKESGATFEVDKTQFIHFGRYQSATQQPWAPLFMDNRSIYSTPTVRILGVIFDQGFRMKAHHKYVSQRATRQAVALGTLQGLRPAAMRSLSSPPLLSKLVLDFCSILLPFPRNKVKIPSNPPTPCRDHTRGLTSTSLIPTFICRQGRLSVQMYSVGVVVDSLRPRLLSIRLHELSGFCVIYDIS